VITVLIITRITNKVNVEINARLIEKGKSKENKSFQFSIRKNIKNNFLE